VGHGRSEREITTYSDAASAQSGSGSGGRLVTYYGPYDVNYRDFDLAGTHPRETIIEGDDLSSYWRGIEDALDDIEAENYAYRPADQNSNTAVDEALVRNGLPQPKLDGMFDYLPPGSGNSLSGGDDVQTGVIEATDVISGIFESIRLWFVQSKSQSPIVLDLDGDGIETTALSHV
jgi:hypothetical protein